MSLSASAWVVCLGVGSRSYAFDSDDIHRTVMPQKQSSISPYVMLSELLDTTTAWTSNNLNNMTISIMLDCCLKLADICILELMEPNFLAASASAVRSYAFDYDGTDCVSEF